MARKAQNKPEKTIESVEAPQVIEKIEEVMQTPSEPEPLSPCGGALRAAREKQKLSVQDVANQLRLGVKQVDALEADRYDKLPQPSIVRGFIRNYAKLLKIDAAPIIEAYSILVPNTTPQSFAVKSDARSFVIGESRAHFSFKLFIGLIITFAFIVWFFYYYTQVIKPNVLSELSNTSIPGLQSEPALPSANIEFALPAAERKPDASVPVELPMPGSDATNNPTQSSGAESSAALVVPSQTVESNNVMTPAITESTNSSGNAIKPSITPAPTALPVPIEQSSSQQNITPQSTAEAKSAQLAIDATEETWVNITDANGKQVYSKVLASGTSETFSVTPPVSITVGNAQGTAISMNGKSLDLMAHTRDRVARLKVN
jgi:cytoskeleton protein RodZ